MHTLYLSGVVICVRRVAVALLVVALGACSKHETQTITSWLRVDVATPKADDFIRVGNRREVYEINRDGRWKRLGVGHSSAYMVLADETAVLLQLNDGKGLQLIRQNEPPRPIPAWFGRTGTVHVAGGSLIDVVATSPPREANVYRYDLSGSQVAHFQLLIPDAYSDCRVAEGITGYGKDFIPYMFVDCRMDSQQAKCLILGPDGFVYPVPPEADWSECGNFGKAGISTTEPARFTVF